jgi:hypothetical protein
MRIKNYLKHTGIVLAGILLLTGIPFLSSDYFKTLLNGNVDEVSSASVIIDRPSGEYIVLVNENLHTDKENLNTWIRFFQGQEISYLFEDISCSVIKGDTGALNMAKSFQSSLPEKQMRIKQEDATLLMSRADNGKYDIIILSKEYANSYDVTTAERENTTLINIVSEREEE